MSRPLALITSFLLWLRGHRTRPRAGPDADARKLPGPPATRTPREQTIGTDPWVTPDGHPIERLSPW